MAWYSKIAIKKSELIINELKVKFCDSNVDQNATFTKYELYICVCI